MEKFKILLITILIGFCFAIPANAKEGIIKSAHYGWPGHMHDNYYGTHHGSLKVADLDLDETNEIVMLQGNVLIVLDNEGTVLITKEINEVANCCYYATQTTPAKDNYNTTYHGGPHHGGPGGGYPGDDDYYNGYPMGGGMAIDVANLDDDANPEIIIRDLEKLIVLDHNGDLETTITLPTVANPYQ